jgi:hypothetical protein
MQSSLYESLLRVSLLTTAIVLVFDSGLVSPVTKHLSDNTVLYLAQTASVVAQVEKNEVNTLSEELRKRDEELDEREAQLRTIEARIYGDGETVDYSTYVLSLILLILTVLVLMNYVLDWKRVQNMRQTA